MDPGPKLIDLAAAIADGAVVDWPPVPAAADDPSHAVIANLRVLEQVASVHATLPPAVTFIESLHSTAFGDATGTWGPLEIIRKIGTGANADVYLARDPRLDRAVALKLLRYRQEAGDASAVIDEARLLARVRHPNVVTVYGADRIDGRTGIWMEYVDGRTLEEELRASGPFSAGEVRQVGIAVAAALGAVHAAGLVHRDVKAQNVLRGPGGRVLLSDFGTGRDAAVGASELAGTPLYLAPEVLTGVPADARSDLYSLGVLLFHLATGAFPVAGRSIADLREAHEGGQPPTVRGRRPDLSRSLAACVDRALSPDPAVRFENSDALGLALEAASVRRPRRHTAVSVMIGLLLIGLSAGAAWTREHPRDRGAVAQRDTVTTNSPEALRLYTESYRLGDKDDFGAALPLIKRALTLDPSFALAHTWEAWCLLNTRAPNADVRAEAQRAVALSGHVTEWERLWIQASYDSFSGQKEAEITALKALLKIRPDFYDAVDNLANVLMSIGLNSESLVYVARRSDLRPDSGRDAMFAGLYLVRAGDRDDGLRYAERARMVAGTLGWYGGAQWAWVTPVEDCLQRADYGAATVMLDQIRAGFVGRPSIERTAMAKLLVDYNLDLGRVNAARAATDLIDDPETRHVNRAAVAFHAGDPRWTREMRFVKGPVGPQDSRTFYLVEAGRFDEATRVINELTLLQTDQGSAEVEVAHIDLKKGQPDHALDILEHARPNTSGSQVFTRFEYLAQLYLRRGDRDRAISTLEASLEVRDSQMLAFWWMRNELRLAELYHEAGRDTDARPLETELDQRLSGADPTFPLLVRLRAVEAKTKSDDRRGNLRD